MYPHKDSESLYARTPVRAADLGVLPKPALGVGRWRRAKRRRPPALPTLVKTPRPVHEGTSSGGQAAERKKNQKGFVRSIGPNRRGWANEPVPEPAGDDLPEHSQSVDGF